MKKSKQVTQILKPIIEKEKEKKKKKKQNIDPD
jgi:hypothetical protein